MHIKKNLKKITVTSDIDLRETLIRLNNGGIQALLVINRDTTFAGIITDGDIRRHLLKDGNLETTIEKVIKKDYTFSLTDDDNELKGIFKRKKINHIPILNKKNQLVALALRTNLKNENYENTNSSIVVMAGGKGSRLAPLTNIIPKPLIPIGYSTIVEKIFDSFVNQGFNNFKLIINYKKELIKSYFSELEHLYNLEFFEESKFLGTIGGIKEFADKLTDNFVVTNCDVVTDINYHNFFEHHIKKDAYLSILGLEKSTKVPYGVLRLDKESNVEGLQEKPKQTHTIMTGIYIINKRALDYIPSDVEFGMDELIETLIANNKAVTSFVIKDGWYDMGQFSEYKKLLMHIDN
jgi:dTDP-glucose pyrophosphorylase